MNWLRILIVILPLLFLNFLVGAADSIPQQTLKAVEIQDKHSNSDLLNTESKVLLIENAQYSGDLLKPIGDWLEQQSNAYLRNSGINSSSTLSIRGASAAQTGIFWNDIPLRNLSSGMADLNAFPNFFFEEAWLLYDGQGSKLGAGSMGGALVLAQTPFKNQTQNKISATSLFQYSSLNNFDFGQKVSLSTPKSTHQIKWISSHYNNNFKLYEAPNNERLDHSQASKISFMTNHQFQLWNPTKVLSIHSWLHQSKLEIPPTRFESVSEKYLNTDFLKLQISLDEQKVNSSFKISMMFATDFYEYQDWSIHHFSPYNYQQVIALMKYEKRMKIKWFNKLWNIESTTKLPIEYSIIQVHHSNNRHPFKMWSGLLSQHIKIQPSKSTFTMDIGWALDIDDRQAWQWLPSLTLKNQFKTLFIHNTMIDIDIGWAGQKGYRKPTLIDLYLFPGGNQMLRPEVAWGMSLNGSMNIYRNYSSGSEWSLKSSGGVYTRKVKDWIYWLGGTIWTPYNIASVYNRGIESEHKFLWKKKLLSIEISGTTAYNLATTIGSSIMEEKDYGKQLPYTPRYQFNYQVALKYQQWSMAYQGNYIGYRFITLDESAYLLPYYLQHLSIAKRIHFKKMVFYPEVKIHNLWNVNYEVISYRPMPGRYIELGVKMDLTST